MDPYVGAGIARGFKQATETLATIMEKKRTRKQEDELFGLKKKEAELKLKEMELTDLDPDTIRLNREKLQADVKLQKAKAEQESLLLEDARKTTTQKLREFKDQLQALQIYDKGQQDALALPGTAPGVGGEGAGMGLPGGWDISTELTLGEEPKITAKTREEPELTIQQQQKADIEKKKVLSILEQGYYTDIEKGKTYAYDLTDRGTAESYIIQNYDIDIADPDIQQALQQYKPTEPEIDTTSWFERVFQKQKYPRKEKYGYTYEQRPDPKTGELKWYKLEEKK